MNGVIFDLDGCLVDSESNALEAIAQEMRSIGISDANSDEIRTGFLGVSMQVICNHVARRSGRPAPQDFGARVEERIFALHEKHLQVMRHCPELLDMLQAQGVATAIATGASLRRMAKTLEYSGLLPRFEGRAFSAEQVTNGKPAPDIFLFAARQINVPPPDCIVLEDSPHGIAGAIAGGMRAIGFIGGSHLEGIRMEHAERLKQAGAEAVIDNLPDLDKYL